MLGVKYSEDNGYKYPFFSYLLDLRGRVLTYIQKGKMGGTIIMLKFKCPECGKGMKSDLAEVLPERRYKMKCNDCGCTYILTTNSDEEKKCERSGERGSC
jgi:hypothetical protein